MGITEAEIKRINELAHKAKAEGLTDAERMEREVLRTKFIASFKANLKAQLDNIDVKEADGSIVNLGERYEARKNGKKGN